MARMRLRLGGLIAGTALALLALGQFGAIQADAGRDFPRCMQSCNETSKACKAQCGVDCSELYTPGPERDSCIVDCEATCIDNSQECKNTCKNIKNPPTDEEP